MSDSLTACAVVTTSVNPLDLARSRVAALRPADTHKTLWPLETRQAATAAPISPGWSTAIVLTMTCPSSAAEANHVNAITCQNFVEPASSYSRRIERQPWDVEACAQQGAAVF